MSRMPTSMPPKGLSSVDATFRSIQALRCVAALLVVLFHASTHYSGEQTAADHAPFYVGNVGVDIFFVISGFVMWTTTCRRQTPPAIFLQQRFIRLVPIYWLFTVILFFVIDIFPHAFPRAAVTPVHLMLSLAFLPHMGPTGSIQPLLAQGWTLNFEMFFYAIFAAALTLTPPRRLLAVAVSLVALTCVGLAVSGAGITQDAQPWTILLSPLLLEFLGGIVLAWLVERGTWPAPIWCWAILLCGVGVLSFETLPQFDDDGQRLLRYGGPAFLIVGGAVGAELGGWLKVSRHLMLLGAASYSIYLTHTFVISALGKIAWVLGLGVLPLAVPVVASIVVGVATYFVVERPLLAALKSQPARPTAKSAMAR